MQVPLPTVAGDVKDIISAFSSNLDLTHEVAYIYLSGSLVHPNASMYQGTRFCVTYNCVKADENSDSESWGYSISRNYYTILYIYSIFIMVIPFLRATAMATVLVVNTHA